MGLTKRKAAEIFGVSVDTITRWEAKPQVERTIALACGAVSYGLPPATS